MKLIVLEISTSLKTLITNACVNIHCIHIAVPPNLNPQQTSSDTGAVEGDTVDLMCNASGWYKICPYISPLIIVDLMREIMWALQMFAILKNSESIFYC